MVFTVELFYICIVTGTEIWDQLSNPHISLDLFSNVPRRYLGDS
jgi:hypothetical protein